MKAQDIALLTLSGFALWLVGTLYYAWRATAIFESTSLRYWISFFLSPILTAVVCIAILKRVRYLQQPGHRLSSFWPYPE